MRIAVAGAGAIGTWLGAALARAGHDVTLLARGAHLEAMRAGGVHVRGSEKYAVRVALEPTGPVDAVFLTVKAHDQAGVDLGPLLGPDTVVVAAQNGIPWWYFHGFEGELEGRRVEAVDPGGAVSAAIPAARALGLVVYMGARISAPGTVEVRPEAGLVIGEPSGEDSPRLRAVAEALEGAGFPVRRTPEIRTEIWIKLMGNAAFNPISMLTGAGLGTMARHPGTRALVAGAMQEAVAIAAALGSQITISIPDRLAITERLGEHKTSMLQDFEAGKRVELDAILAAPVELAHLTSTPAPTLEALLALADLKARARHNRSDQIG
jgi:2-dehydropantoate 2-reductase